MKFPRIFINLSIVICSIFYLLFVDGNVHAQEMLSNGETVYVPIYSNVYIGPKPLSFELSAMLSIRNTDSKYPINVHLADYYNTKGEKIAGYIEGPIQLKPLETTSFNIGTYDKRGGTGANFIVKWSSEEKVNKPIIEGLMLGGTSGQGISFICTGIPIIEHTEKP